MESKNRRSRKNRVEEDDERDPDLDRIRSLPDSILAHILSFLDTRFAIKTPVLAKRYQLLWTLTPCLDFSFSDYQTDRFESYDGRAFSPVKNSSLVAFGFFVNRVLQLRESINLVKFRMSLHKDVGSDFLDNCIHSAARHKVHVAMRM